MRRLGAIAALCGLLTGCENGCDGWNKVFERMVNQPKDKTFGATMQLPPRGAIPREVVIDDIRLTEGTTPDHAWLKDFPVPLTPELLERGRDRFNITCAACHGVLGDGDTPVAAKMQLRKPPSLRDADLVALPPGHVYAVIHHGYGLMPSYDDQLDLHDRWAVVAYVKALQLSQGVPIVSLPPAVREEAERALR